MIQHFNVHTAISNDQARHFNLLLPQVSSSSALLCYKATKNTRSRLNTHTKNWNSLVELFLGDLSYVFKMSRPLHNVKFIINLVHGDKLIGRFYYMVFRTKTYTSLVSALVKSISDKRAAKKWKSLVKIFSLDVGTTVRHTFPSSELRCLPCGDPKNLCVNTRIWLLATHSLHALCFMWCFRWEWCIFPTASHRSSQPSSLNSFPWD